MFDHGQLADLVERCFNQVRAVTLGVTDARAAGNAIKATVDAFGRLEVLINNAGYGNVASIEDTIGVEGNLRRFGTSVWKLGKQRRMSATVIF